MSLKEKIRNNHFTLGSWITLASPDIAEIMAQSGFDWLTVDMEHSAITLDIAQQLIRVIELCGTVPLVRVGENNPHLIKRVMDAGAHGVIVPMINTQEEAERAVQAVKYPPVGKRGVGLARAQGYGLEFEKYKAWVHRESIVVAQIENILGIQELENILKVDGIDATMIGPYDLSASIGNPGDFDHPQVKDALSKYQAIHKKSNKTMGFHVIPPRTEEVESKEEDGYRFISWSLDTLFLGTACREGVQTIKGKAVLVP